MIHERFLEQYMLSKFFFFLLEKDAFAPIKGCSKKEYALALHISEGKGAAILTTLCALDWAYEKNGYYFLSKDFARYYSSDSRDYLGKEILWRKDVLTSFGKRTEGQENRDMNWGKNRNKEIEVIQGSELQKEVQHFFTLAPDILDLGGGDGRLALYLRNLWPEIKITLLDLCSPEKKEGIRVLCRDFNEEDFGGEYDLVLASGIVEFICMEGKFFQFLEKAVKPGGYVFFYSFSIEAEKDGLRHLRWFYQLCSGMKLNTWRQVEDRMQAFRKIKKVDGVYPLLIFQKSRRIK